MPGAYSVAVDPGSVPGSSHRLQARPSAVPAPTGTCPGEETIMGVDAADILQAERGLELVRLQLEEMITKINRRAAAHSLDRGLSISLPYYDDQALELRWREIEIIPPGRVMFMPAFVVLAAQRERERIAADRALSPATRAHLRSLIDELERAFRYVE